MVGRIASLGFCFASCAAGAQDVAQALETVLVTGTRLQSERVQPGFVTVIDEQTIRARNDGSVLDLLRDVSGVHVSLPSGRGGVGSVFIRGGEANFAAVLIDGIQVNDPTNTRGGSFDFSTLNIDDIERIAIVRGPQSSVYGSDALSGVINVITHRGGEELGISADAELGTRHYARGGLRISGPALEAAEYSVRVGAVRDGDADDAEDFRGHSVVGKVSFLGGGPRSVTLYARHAAADSRAFPEDSGGPLLAALRARDVRESTDSSLGLDLNTRLTQTAALHLSAQGFDHREDVFSPGVAQGVRSGVPPNRSDNEFSRLTFNVYATLDLTPRLTSAFGLGYEEERGESIGAVALSPELTLPSGYALARDDASAFGEIAFISPNGFDVSAALRSDRTETSRRETTGRLAMGYALAGGAARVHLGWGRGFKLPSLFALGHPLAGNPDLNPERVDSAELGLDLELLDGALWLRAAAFEQRFEDLIDFDIESFRSVNRARVNTDGFELSARYRRSGSHWELAGYATHVDIDVLDSTVILRQRPDLTAGASVLWAISPAWSARFGWRYVDERFDSAVPVGPRVLPGYRHGDFALSWHSSPALQWSFAVDNVFDEAFEEAIGFPSPGRRLRVSVRRVFGPQARGQ